MDNCLTPNALKILMIDDNQDFAEIMCELMEMLGHEASFATKGSEGIVKAKQFQPDVIICDIGLPEMNGYEVAQLIRSDHGLKDIFLIALSGYTSQDDHARSMAAGFDRHLAKPVDIDIIENILAEFNKNIFAQA